MLHKAWNSKEEMPYCFPRSSIKFLGHTGQNITDFDPNWAFPDYRPVAAFKSLRFALLRVRMCPNWMLNIGNGWIFESHRNNGILRVMTGMNNYIPHRLQDLITYTCPCLRKTIPDSKLHGANMGPIWGRQDPGGTHVGPMNFDIWVCLWSGPRNNGYNIH